MKKITQWFVKPRLSYYGAVFIGLTFAAFADEHYISAFMIVLFAAVSESYLEIWVEKK